ncbi:cell surface A33 antigen-like [Labrus mixtus]|uniref:cell surface A33 antigen-like n=1 Tax=Labrus mixtus TaxID=508554 RepID=UPI0029BFE970|nr:cell surface A33 antigen-like [Labrus mixtus]
MMTKLQHRWRLLFLILQALSCCSGMQVSIKEKGYEVARDGEITLTCSFSPARPVTNALVLTWEASPDEPGKPMKAVATYFINNPIDISPAYEGRAFVEVDVNSKVSTLRLTKVTMKDNRDFQCSVKVPNDDEGVTAATTSLLVLVRPSPPICKIQGTAEYFHDISLTCMSEEGSPLPSYKWMSYTVQNVSRPFPLKTTEEDGVLSLFNVSQETSGFYMCSSTNRIGTAKCELTLAVMPGSMNVGSTAAIIGGVIAGLLVLAIVVFCCCRRKGKNEEQEEGSPGDAAYYDKDAAEAEEYLDDKSNTKPKQKYKDEDKDVVPQSNYSVGLAVAEDDQHSNHSGRGRSDGKGSDFDSRRYQEDQRDQYHGSRDRLDDQRDHYRGSRDRLDDQRDTYRGSRDRLDDQRDTYRGSRDRLDDQRDTYRGSRDRLDDQRDTYRGSRDRLDDPRDHYRGSRDRLDDNRHDRHGGSRDHIDYIDDDRNGYR